MKELLDDYLQGEEKKAPRWYEQYAFYIYRKLYRNTYVVAGSMLLLLFFRDTLHIKKFLGCDLDAVLALIILWAVMVNLFYKINQHFWTSSIVGIVLLFGVFLNYAPSVVATIHGTELFVVTQWRWSHYELVFGGNLYSFNETSPIIEGYDLLYGPRTFFTSIIECTEWVLFYILLTALAAEILGLGIRKN